VKRRCLPHDILPAQIVAACFQDFNQKMAVHIAQGIENIVRIGARQKLPHEREIFLHVFIIRPLIVVDVFLRNVAHQADRIFQPRRLHERDR
jgi:hypothetical protein